MGSPYESAPERRWISVPLLVLLTLLIASVWILIAQLAGKASVSQAVSTGTGGQAEIAAAYTRSGVTRSGTRVQATFATPKYYEQVNQPEVGRELAADQYLVFVVTEENHSQVAPAPLPVLLVDGTPVKAPARERMVTGSEHHRVRLIRFQRVDTAGTPYVDPKARSIELVWPEMEPKHNPDHSLVNPLKWAVPIQVRPMAAAGSLTLPLFLTLTAGLFAALSPCLVQLTLYYVSTLAGVSAQSGVYALSPAVSRRAILRTGAWFVAGVSIAYTLGGALAGFAGQLALNSGILGGASKPVAIAAGSAVVLMGLYTGASARAPVLCKLPLPRLSRWAGLKGGPGSLAMGFAVALGCLQCFGGAIFASLMLYVGTLGSPLLGASMLFLFSLGIAVPFLMAALYWSRVSRLVDRMERAAPVVALLSSGVMILLGGLMIIDRFHWVSGLILRWMPFLQV